MKLIPRLTALRQFDTCRLIPSRFADLEDSVLAPLADDDGMLRDLFDLDNATNDRLRGESGLLPGIGVDELVFGVPHFRIINAAYTYARPEGSRFNDGDRGAWYCAFDADTALAEVAFHKAVEYHEINRFDDSVTYQALLADFSATFHDLRGADAWQACLDLPSARAENIAVAASHLGLGHHPAVIWAVADRLAQPRGQWAPFRPPSTLRRLYPRADTPPDR